MAVNVKASTFSTGVDESMAAVDVYNLDTTTKLTTVADITADNGTDSAKTIISSTTNSTKLLNQLSGLKTDGLGSESVTSVIGAVSQDSKDALGSLTSASKGTLLANITTTNLSNSISVTVDGVTSKVKNADAGVLNTVTTAFGKITNGAVSVLSTASKTALAVTTSAIKAALKIGIDGTLASVLKNTPNQGIKDTLIKSVLKDVVKATAVNDLFAASTNASKGVIKQTMPNINNNIATNFKSYSDLSDKEVDSNFTNLFGALKNIHGSDTWYSKPRSATDKSLNLSEFITTNQNFKAAVGRIKPNYKDYSLNNKQMASLFKSVNIFKPTTVQSSISTQHPDTYVEANPQTKQDLTVENV